MNFYEGCSSVVCYYIGDIRESAVAACLNSRSLAAVAAEPDNRTALVDSICEQASRGAEPSLLIFTSAWNWRWTHAYWNQFLRHYDCIYYICWSCQPQPSSRTETCGRVLFGDSEHLITRSSSLQFNELAVDLVGRLQYADVWMHARDQRCIARSEPPPPDIYITLGIERMLALQRSQTRKQSAYDIVRSLLRSPCRGDPFASLIQYGKDQKEKHSSGVSHGQQRRRRRRRPHGGRNKRMKTSEIECLRQELKEHRAAMSHVLHLMKQHIVPGTAPLPPPPEYRSLRADEDETQCADALSLFSALASMQNN